MSDPPLSLRIELEELLRRHGARHASDTPDRILATYMLACLKAFDEATIARDKWWEKGATIKRRAPGCDD